MYLLMAYFTIHHWLTLQTSGYFSRKGEIWKHDDYHINIHSILTFNGFLVISIHIWSCQSDFRKYLLAFTPSNCVKLTGLIWIEESGHFYRHHSNQKICGKITFLYFYNFSLPGSFKRSGRKVIWVSRGRSYY